MKKQLLIILLATTLTSCTTNYYIFVQNVEKTERKPHQELPSQPINRFSSQFRLVNDRYEGVSFDSISNEVKQRIRQKQRLNTN